MRTRAVYTMPWWLAIVFLPFWLAGMVLWGVLALFWLAFVLPWKFVARACASLRSPLGVDTVGDTR